MRLSAAFHTVMNDRDPADDVTLTAPAANVTLIPIRVG